MITATQAQTIDPNSTDDQIAQMKMLLAIEATVTINALQALTGAAIVSNLSNDNNTAVLASLIALGYTAAMDGNIIRISWA